MNPLSYALPSSNPRTDIAEVPTASTHLDNLNVFASPQAPGEEAAENHSRKQGRRVARIEVMLRDGHHQLGKRASIGVGFLRL
jgi:hypothetical protein